jgi:hypothetical protein
MEVEIQDEKHTGRVAAVFGDKDSAPTVINIVKPEDNNISKKIEPESHGIAKTIVKSHGWLGLIGMILGLIIATALVISGPEMTQSSPLFTYLVFIFFGLTFGMMIAGAVSIRPDHDPLITKTVEASHENHWTVIVQTDDHEEIDLIKDLLEGSAISISETF